MTTTREGEEEEEEEEEVEDDDGKSRDASPEHPRRSSAYRPPSCVPTK
jgi:hypothetical protein